MTDDAAKAFVVRLNCFFATLFRPNPDRVGNRFYEYFPVAILSCARLVEDCFNNGLTQRIGGDHFDAGSDGKCNHLLLAPEPTCPLFAVAGAPNLGDCQT